MQEKGVPICLPAMRPETARLRILELIHASTGGNPSNNKDGGEWMAFMALPPEIFASGNKVDATRRVET